MSTETESTTESLTPKASPAAAETETSSETVDSEAVETAVASDDSTASAPDDSDATGIAVEGADAPAPKVINANMKWFAVQTYSGYEMRVKASIDGEVKKRAMEDVFGEVLIPTETVEEIVNGKRRQVKRKFMPGYILVHMELSDETEYLVTATSKVSGFVGVPKNRRAPPIPVPDREVARLTKQIVEGVKATAPVILYEVGEQVRVKEGPFENFNGNIEEVKPDKQKVMVTVSIFGRSTPVELDYSQIEKIAIGAE